MHGRIIDLDLLLTLHYPIKEVFEYQGWAKVFSSSPKVVYKPLVRLFYANLRFSKPDEVETLVLGKRIFLDYDILDEILKINCPDFSDPIKNSWPSKFDVTFEEAKRHSFPTPLDIVPQPLDLKMSHLKLVSLCILLLPLFSQEWILSPLYLFEILSAPIAFFLRKGSRFLPLFSTT